MMWQYWLGKIKPKWAFRSFLGAFKKLLWNFKKLFNGIFYWLANCLTDWLMLSDKTISRDTGLIFSLFNVASAQKMPFGAPLFIQCILQGLPVPFFVSHSSLLTAKCWFCGRHVMVSISNGNCLCTFHSGYFDCRSSFKQFLIHTAVLIEHSRQRSIFFSDDNWCHCFDAVYVGSLVIKLCCIIITVSKKS